MWTWGNNVLGQLGDGTRTRRDEPVRIGDGFVQVATGRFHGIALAGDGSVWTWGDNDAGVIGDGTTTPRLRPVKIAEGFVKVAAGDHHNLALKADGTVWAWGNNEVGQLGDGTTLRRLVPVRVGPSAEVRRAAAPSGGVRPGIESVRVGRDHACAFYRDGRIKCWGSNSEGQLGIDPAVDESRTAVLATDKDRVLAGLASNTSRHLDCRSAQARECARIDTRLRALRDAAAIVDDGTSLCAVMKDGKVHCGREPEGWYSDFVVEGLDDVVQIDRAWDLSCALLADGCVKCWGVDMHGELGDGAIRTTPNFSGYRAVATPVAGL